MRRIRRLTRCTRRGSFERRRVFETADRHRVRASTARLRPHLNKTAVSCVYGVQRLTNDYKLSLWQITGHYSCTFGVAGDTTTLLDAHAAQPTCPILQRGVPSKTLREPFAPCFHSPCCYRWSLVIVFLTPVRHSVSPRSLENFMDRRCLVWLGTSGSFQTNLWFQILYRNRFTDRVTSTFSGKQVEIL